MNWQEASPILRLICHTKTFTHLGKMDFVDNKVDPAPDSAILSDQSQRFACTLGKDDVPEPRVVEPGNLERGLRIIRGDQSVHSTARCR